MITVLFGANRYALGKQIGALVDDFISKNGDAGVERFLAEQIEANQLTSIITSASLFASQRLVIITGLAGDKQLAEVLEKNITHIPEEVHVVLVETALDKRTTFYKVLKKQAMLEEFAEMDEEATSRWVVTQSDAEGATITLPNARLLVRYVGTDQLQLTNEIAKLAAYNNTITEETIELLVDKKPQETIFQLLEYTLGKKGDQAMNVLHALEEAHDDPYQIANMLIWQTHILAVVSSAEGVPEHQLVKDTKINPYVIKKTKALASNLSKQQVNRIVDTVATLDTELKSTAAHPWRILEATILSII